MSLLPMHKKCTHCGKKIYYNPSVGSFGTVCSKCGFPQEMTFPGETQKKTAFEELRAMLPLKK